MIKKADSRSDAVAANTPAPDTSATNGSQTNAPHQETRKREKRKKKAVPRVLPTGSDYDSYRSWGDSDDSNDERLRREKPPHW